MRLIGITGGEGVCLSTVGQIFYDVLFKSNAKSSRCPFYYGMDCFFVEQKEKSINYFSIILQMLVSMRYSIVRRGM